MGDFLPFHELSTQILTEFLVRLSVVSDVGHLGTGATYWACGPFICRRCHRLFAMAYEEDCAQFVRCTRCNNASVILVDAFNYLRFYNAFFADYDDGEWMA